jgi:hypothetical protein
MKYNLGAYLKNSVQVTNQGRAYLIGKDNISVELIARLPSKCAALNSNLTVGEKKKKNFL